MIFFDRETFYDMANANPNTIQDKVLIDYQESPPVQVRSLRTLETKQVAASR